MRKERFETSVAGGVLCKFARYQLEVRSPTRWTRTAGRCGRRDHGLRLRRIRRPVDQALANVIKKSVVQTDDVSAEELKAGLAEAQTWDGG